MPDEDEDDSLLTPQSREAHLWRLYDLLLIALVREVAQPTVRAALLEVARQFLKDNETSAYRATDIRRGLAMLAGKRDLPFDS